MKSVRVIALVKDGGSIIFACDGERYILDQAINSKTHGRIFKMQPTGSERDKMVDAEAERMLKSLLREQTNLR